MDEKNKTISQEFEDIKTEMCDHYCKYPGIWDEDDGDPVVYKTILPMHYKIQQLVDIGDIVYLQTNPQLLKTHIENRILQELRPLIWDNLKTEKDFYSGKYRYWLDIWVEPQERSDKG